MTVSLANRVEERARQLLERFRTGYLQTAVGEGHLARYPALRETAHRNWSEILERRRRGEDVTDLVLTRLLPHADTEPNRNSGVWIHVAPAVSADVRTWFGALGYPCAADWQGTAVGILTFVQRALESPGDIEAACQEFADSPLSKGFQSGMLSPILNALRPEWFHLLNNKSRDMLNGLTSASFQQALTDYPAANRAMAQLVDRLKPWLHELAPKSLPSDVLDAFSHWARVEGVEFSARSTRAWVCEVPDASAWERWRSREVVEVALGQVGDLSGLARADVEGRVDGAARDQGLNRSHLSLLVPYSRDIEPGSRLVARAGERVLGIGTVTGAYVYKEGAHRLPIRWDDLRERLAPSLASALWLEAIPPKRFHELLAQGAGLAEPFNRVFVDVDEGLWAFGFMETLIRRLGGSGAEDLRFWTNAPDGSKGLRLGFCNLLVADFVQATSTQDRGVTLPLLKEDLPEDRARSSGPLYSGMESALRPYTFSLGEVRDMDPELDDLVARSMAQLVREFRAWKVLKRSKHRAELLEAVFQPERRRVLLTGGMGGPEPQPVGGEWEEPAFPDIQQTLRSEGLRVSDRSLRRYHASLKTRGFVILTGVSGTGKSWLATAYARAVSAEHLLVPVAPNWTTNEDLLGHWNPLDDQYHHTAASLFLLKAADEFDRAHERGAAPQPYHLILDELNLAPVEYYFARFLSAMEVRARGERAEIPLGPKLSTVLTPNLFVIGTVNVDETTRGFSDKVFDRAQTVELVPERQHLEEHLAGQPYGSVLLQVWDVLSEAAPFSFRVLDEVCLYTRACSQLEIDWREAVDEQVVQKVLPRLRGADARTREALEAFLLVAEEHGLELSRAKARAMLKKLEEHGFVSFFLG